MSLNTEAKEAFARILSLDKKLCGYSRDLLKEVIKRKRRLRQERPEEIERNIAVAGSLTEGGAIARIFYENDIFPNRLNKEGEVDIECIILEIPEANRDYVEDLKDRPGYVKLHVDEDLVVKARELGWYLSDEDVSTILKNTSPEGFLQPYNLKAIIQKNVTSGIDTIKDIGLGLAVGLNKRLVDFEVEHLPENITKAGVCSEYLLKVHQQPFWKVSIDVSALLKLEWWPSIGDEWKNRKRMWPPPEIIEELTTTSYIIAKPSNKFDFKTVELRYSFSHIERVLVSKRTDNQHLIYFIFKCMFYKWIKPIPARLNLPQLNEQHELHSFIVKNIMFFMCEDFSREHEMWNAENTKNALSHLFNLLLKAFQERNLPYYFISSINILQEIPSEIQSEACNVIRSILLDVEAYVRFCSQFEHEAIEELVDLVSKCHELLEAFNNEDHSVLIKCAVKYPHLFLDFSEFFFRKRLKKIDSDFYQTLEDLVLKEELQQAGNLVKDNFHRLRIAAKSNKVEEGDQVDLPVEELREIFRGVNQVSQSAGEYLSRAEEIIGDENPRFREGLRQVGEIVREFNRTAEDDRFSLMFEGLDSFWKAFHQ